MQTATQESNTVQTSMQRAILSASNKVADITKTPVTATPSKDLQAIIVRRRIEGTLILFIVDTHKKMDDGSERIAYWEAGNHALKEAPIQLYKASTPVEGAAEDVMKFTASYAKQFKVANLLQRQRLIKNQFAERQEDGSVSKEALQTWKADFEKKANAAFQKMMSEVLASM
jgi:hypothetical protein